MRRIRRCFDLSNSRRSKSQLSQKGALLLLILMFGVIVVTTLMIVLIFGAPKSSYPKREALETEVTETVASRIIVINKTKEYDKQTTYDEYLEEKFGK